METDTLVRITSQGLLLCLSVSMPVVAVAALSGLAISFVQAITSMQDQSISYAVKLVAVVATVLITGAWGAAAILRFANQIITLAVPS
ncbi:type III secretion system export apparatus subunit SctS [Burkholderia ambifaria]|mgnify:CR=1 FL=1|jgi:type III secretion protein S|uniref:Type III secretion protein, HrpO family n=1 Tax=Burkholderia ambifaria (strain ATCC BAA-244 / DSM 16087 / CCUG 44356 / LMG 19182 / AMMD) TaxID=339670 RepID=Q0B365_BURCM|nr:type III secretion system export apparatus subunit SctS [Burkholderia ambifaria]MDP9584863.1 type III secretion protein S [Burkholderia contaminans]ABI91408.1 type III secretion protein, HrpO family [Burkholderia ambifaria AMMD]AJY26021.1 type III secretion, HrpO family protein [Burkholderia ambifaria AMMD]ELK6206418.1 type III secretion system export apparatus subunit SctS [Burkholderia ambifaria]MBR7932233.1 type III secretion system export apparatus subunit SctS [Burkholderia ambifaria]